MVDDGDINLAESLAKFGESQKYLAQVLLDQQRVLDANKPARRRSAAEQRHERRRNSFNLQMNIMGLATGGRVIPSLDNDNDIRPDINKPRFYGGSKMVDKSQSREDKIREMMAAFYGRNG